MKIYFLAEGAKSPTLATVARTVKIMSQTPCVAKRLTKRAKIMWGSKLNDPNYLANHLGRNDLIVGCEEVDKENIRYTLAGDIYIRKFKKAISNAKPPTTSFEIFKAVVNG